MVKGTCPQKNRYHPRIKKDRPMSPHRNSQREMARKGKRVIGEGGVEKAHKKKNCLGAQPKGKRALGGKKPNQLAGVQ